MNLTQLRAFHLVARERGFTRAAETAGVSQPTLSSQVNALERAHAVRLLDRRGRLVQLTELGRSLFDVTTRLFALEDEAAGLLGGARAETAPRLHLRVAADNAFHVVPILAALKRTHPSLTFRLAIGNSAATLGLLHEDAVDVAVTARRVSDPRLWTIELRRDRLVLFVGSDHPWRRRARLRLAELAGQPLVLRERGSVTREVFEEALAAARVTPGALIEVETREAVRETVAAGFGVGVVFASEFRRDRRFSAIDVADAALEVGEFAACLSARRHVALVAAFMNEAAGSVRRRARHAPS
jgi:aminoethylphosphonate catabolism LysR family transcriptional regulator